MTHCPTDDCSTTSQWCGGCIGSIAVVDMVWKVAAQWKCSVGRYMTCCWVCISPGWLHLQHAQYSDPYSIVLVAPVRYGILLHFASCRVIIEQWNHLISAYCLIALRASFLFQKDARQSLTPFLDTVKNAWNLLHKPSAAGFQACQQAFLMVCKVRFIVSVCCNTSEFPIILKVECLLTLTIWSYGHEAEEYIFLNLPFPSNPTENSSIRCILSTPEQNLLWRIIGCTPNTYQNTKNKNVNHSNHTIVTLNQSSFH